MVCSYISAARDIISTSSSSSNGARTISQCPPPPQLFIPQTMVQATRITYPLSCRDQKEGWWWLLERMVIKHCSIPLPRYKPTFNWYDISCMILFLQFCCLVLLLCLRHVLLLKTIYRYCQWWSKFIWYSARLILRDSQYHFRSLVLESGLQGYRGFPSIV